MPHYNDLCQLSPFNFMGKAAKDDDQPSAEEEVWRSFHECFQWVSIPVAADSCDRPSAFQATETMLDKSVVVTQEWQKIAGEVFRQPLSEGPMVATQKLADPPILAEPRTVFFTQDLFLAETLEDYNDRLKQSRALCLANLRRKNVNEATIKEKIYWHDGYQKWELTLWGTCAD